MNLIAQAANNLLEKGDPFVLATIISHSGSTPRTAGSRMIITGDGRGIGTIGGGLLEAHVMARAVELIACGQSAIMPFDLSFPTVDTMDMICGGRAEVLLDCIVPDPANVALFDRWQAMTDNREVGWLLTVVAGGDTVERIDRCLLTADGVMIGEWPRSDLERQQVTTAAMEATAITTVVLDDAFVVVELAQRASTVHLFGAGHVALCTARVAHMVGFRVVVADDRTEYANARRFPDAHEIRVLERFDQALAGQTVGGDDYVVILTRGHLHDQTVLAQALRTDAGYIGMIGSHRKRDAIYRALRKDGISQTNIDRVHSPIGVSIGAETPEEIAVSIVAELIAVRARNRS
jgi:xanthine dehydrogenase accessory factor